MKAIIINRQKKINLDTDFFKKISSYIGSKFDNSKNAVINIVFVGREEIYDLNKKYRNIDGPTDVLSFSYNNNLSEINDFKSVKPDVVFKDKDNFYTVGEIIISPEIALDNMNSLKNEKGSFWNLNREVALLIIHGVLHIYGYDHERKSERINMESIQISLCNDIFSNFNF